MTLLLRLTALLVLAWAVSLLALKGRLLGPGELTALVRALANALAIANLAFAYLFWHAARDPGANRGAVYTALILLALKLANDVYGVLVLLPPDEAVISLADLVLSLALFVGMLEALPRMLSGGK